MVVAVCVDHVVDQDLKNFANHGSKADQVVAENILRWFCFFKNRDDF